MPRSLSEVRDLAWTRKEALETATCGPASLATIDASGSTEADLSAFSMVDADVEAGGKSQVTVNPSGKLDVDASNGAQVIYLGSPTLGKIDTSGSASIEQK